MAQDSSLHISDRATRHALVLWSLLCLFVLRVVGQLLVASGVAPALPPMHEWQSGLLPYPVLVVCQIVIIVFFLKVCIDITFGTGYFSRPRKRLGRNLRVFACIYFCSMILRYIAFMALVPEARWFHGTIPIVFHMVLASYLFTLGCFNKVEEGAKGKPS